MSQKTSLTSVEVARREKGLKAYQAAEALGLSASYYSEIEQGKKAIPSHLLAKFREVLGDDALRKPQLPENATSPRAMLKEARLRKGLSQAQLAKKVGYSVGLYQQIEDGLSSMGEKQARKVAAELDLDVDVLLGGSDHPVERGSVRGTFGSIPEIQMGPGLKAKFVPLLSMAQCGVHGAWDDTAYTREGFVAFNSSDPNAFAVVLAGDSMLPKYGPGAVAVVYPNGKPCNGDIVIAKLSADLGADVMFKVYQASGDNVTLSSYNPAFPAMQYKRSAFEWIYPVASVTDVLKKAQ
jgi:transcriptional regulator with XRE-family HTH domain